jgi:hypothetical protein
MKCTWLQSVYVLGTAVTAAVFGGKKNVVRIGIQQQMRLPAYDSTVADVLHA